MQEIIGFSQFGDLKSWYFLHKTYGFNEKPLISIDIFGFFHENVSIMQEITRFSQFWDLKIWYFLHKTDGFKEKPIISFAIFGFFMKMLILWKKYLVFHQFVISKAGISSIRLIVLT